MALENEIVKAQQTYLSKNERSSLLVPVCRTFQHHNYRFSSHDASDLINPKHPYFYSANQYVLVTVVFILVILLVLFIFGSAVLFRYRLVRRRRRPWVVLISSVCVSTRRVPEGNRTKLCRLQKLHSRAVRRRMRFFVLVVLSSNTW